MSRKIGPLVASDQKYCFRCQTIKPRTGFGSDKSKPDGQTHHCKECAKAARVARKEVKDRMEALHLFIQSRRSDARLIDLVGIEVEMAA